MTNQGQGQGFWLPNQTKGDLATYDPRAEWEVLPIGSTNQVLGIASGKPAWTTLGNGIINLALSPQLTDQTDTHGSSTHYGHVHFADGADAFVWYSPVVLPGDYSSGLVLKMSLLVDGTSAGNIRIQAVVAATAQDGDAATTLLLNDTANQTAPTAANTTKRYSWTPTSPTAGDMLAVLFQYVRTNVGDTNTDQVSHLTAWLEYTRKP